MKSTIFWDITPLKVNRRFGGINRLHLQGRRISRARNHREIRWKCLNFNGLHGVISQKAGELRITTGVRTSNPTCKLHYSGTDRAVLLS
jgi:hypothetical protein